MRWHATITSRFSKIASINADTARIILDKIAAITEERKQKNNHKRIYEKIRTSKEHIIKNEQQKNRVHILFH